MQLGSFSERRRRLAPRQLGLQVFQPQKVPSGSCVVLELVLLRGENCFTRRPQSRILVPFRGYDYHLNPFNKGVPPARA